MTRRNRVTPFSTVIADPARGLFMGNRGCLHDPSGTLLRPFRGRLWITCLIRFNGRRRALMQPGRYTELFFLDEAVALAAGHRPCAECRRDRFRAFADAWHAAGLARDRRPRAVEIDEALHRARLDGRGQRRHFAAAASLPDGTMIRAGAEALLLAGAGAHVWSPGGYARPSPRPGGTVEVLTPAPIVAVLSAGYLPTLHPTASDIAMSPTGAHAPRTKAFVAQED